MSMKKWLAALSVVGVLAVAFFWGGDYPDRKKPTGAVLPESVAIEPNDSALADARSGTEGAPSGPELPTSADRPESPSAPAEADDAAPEPKPSEATKPKPVEKEADAIAEAAASGEPTPRSDHAPPSQAEAVQASDAASPSAGPIVPSVGADADTEPTAKDAYLTDPAPPGNPAPVERQEAEIDKEKRLTVTLSVTCETILDNLDSFNPDKLEVLPEDGVIYEAKTVEFREGESAFDVLLREMKANEIHMEFSMVPLYDSNYIEGINNIYEFDCGELSGWMYKVNGRFPNYGSSRYALKDGDVVEWVYTCDLGRDVGDDSAASEGAI